VELRYSKFWCECTAIMSRSIFSKKQSEAHLSDPRGPLSSKCFPLLLQMDCEYCVALIHKQAPRLLPASRPSFTHGDHRWKILYLVLYRWYSSSVNLCKSISCEIFGWVLWSWISKVGKFLLKLKVHKLGNLHLCKITRYTVIGTWKHQV